ncbi:MAG: kfra protein, partial [Gammaproteobacteria bacterium]|nr:kfra protein [Gammaproteobacteria bacterium]
QVQANKEASTAREDAAKLRGQVEAMQTQAAELVRALSDRPAQQVEDGQPATKPAKGKKGE